MVYGGHERLWVDISKKTAKERVNLAIVRIKEETDFLDNSIIKFVEVLNELEFIDEKVYERIKYGTDDIKKIVMIRNGISSTLSSLLLEKYMKFVHVDVTSNTVKIKPDIVRAMQEQGENRVLVFEVRFNTSAE
jgi:glutamine cyclotransferase